MYSRLNIKDMCILDDMCKCIAAEVCANPVSLLFSAARAYCSIPRPQL